MKLLNSNNNIQFSYTCIVFLVLLCSIFIVLDDGYTLNSEQSKTSNAIAGVCPPFHLLDEEGKIINPISGINADKPYSPRQTCGACHDYEKITQGYHFTQGTGEKPTKLQAERCQWASTPGDYGGTWCSPAPLYKYLSPKHNTSARAMDMTSFSFITTGCGRCHPGGGPTEFDREGNRYDKFMQDKGLTSGGENNFDGDYYQARWSETGVLEADCMICHLPEYSFSERKKQLEELNFRWAPTSSAGFGVVSGSVNSGSAVKVVYNQALFDSEGKISPHLVREPRDKACLACHAKPGWKKRGANFRSRTDVHIRAGLKCVDCHPAGTAAVDERMREKETHQFGKGDDPGGHVRDDLNNTCRDCIDCHSDGYLGATIAQHRWLSPLHLDNIACQTCHIPQRTVKAAQFQAGDVFNPGTKIPTKGKHLWTFYGPDMKYWNHYGDLEMMGYDDKPTEPFEPILTRYKGKIFSVNRVHSAWPAIEIEGKVGLMQPKMGDIYNMWTTHFKDASKYPELSSIKDDNADGVIEVNRPEEIDALISAVTSMLQSTGYPMDGKKVVWGMDDRIYSAGNEYRTIPMQAWEASPYANVHKYNHDVYPAKTALGTNGCTDCHHPKASFFFADVVKYPFGIDGKPVTMPQYQLLGINGAIAAIGAWREAYFKPILYFCLILFGCVLIGLGVRFLLEHYNIPLSIIWRRLLPILISIAAIIGAILIILQPELRQYAFPARAWFDGNNLFVSMMILLVSIIFLFQELKRPSDGSDNQISLRGIVPYLIGAIAILIISGFLMLIKIPWIENITRISYTTFNLSLILLLLGILSLSCKKLFVLDNEIDEPYL